jgi:hypothetical protein
MPAPADAERRLAEAGRALRSIIGLKQFLRQEIFYGCPYRDQWQRELLSTLETAGVIERGEVEMRGAVRDIRWKLKDEERAQTLIEDSEELSKLLWPDAFGLSNNVVELHEEPTGSEPVPQGAAIAESPESPEALEVLQNLILLTVRIQELLVEQRTFSQEVVKPSIEVLLEGVATLETRITAIEQKLEEKK